MRKKRFEEKCDTLNEFLGKMYNDLNKGGTKKAL
jgi:hypothetical protein